MPATLDPGALLAAQATQFLVVRFDRTATGADRFQVLPNVRVDSYHYQEGPVVPTAQFSYVLDDTDPSSPFPYLIEQLWPLAASGRYVVQADDELLVYAYDQAGNRTLVGDYFASIPQVEMGHGLSVSFAGAGVGIRLWDEPIGDAVYRDADRTTSTDVGDTVDTGLPVWFNPGGKPNATPDGYDVHEGADNAYPCFLDDRLPQVPGATPTVPAFWTLGGMIRYLFVVHNQSSDPTGNPWVNDPVAPTGVTIDDYLHELTPASGDTGYMDPSNPATYTAKPITIRSYDATGKALLEAAAEQLGYYGFRVFLNTREDPADPGAPLNEVVIYRVDGRDMVAPKALFFPPDRSLLTQGVPDFSGLALARDNVGAANEFFVETAPVEYQVGLVLAPGFPILAADAASSTAIKAFETSALANAPGATRKKYRYYAFDEAGLGHWDYGSATFVTANVSSLDDVFGTPKEGVRQYAVRLRRALETLFAVDDQGNKIKAQLLISRDYAGPVPGIWNGSGTWRNLGDSGWKLDDDSLSVWLTASNPEKWKVVKGDDGIVPGDVVRGITSQANPSGSDTRFYLRLECVIRGDLGIDAVAEKRAASPMRYPVRRRVEARDHWKKQVVHTSSGYNTTGSPYTVRDDTDKAQAQADAMRAAREMPPVAGSYTAPWVTRAVGIGDLISQINGRNIDLLANAGAAAGEGPRYPAVVGVSVACQNPQATQVKLSDRRTEPEDAGHGYGRRSGRSY
jgi:hypothetical protein